jgi:acyl-CoA dehydrogenase
MAWISDRRFSDQLDWMDRFVTDEVEPLDLVFRGPADPFDPARAGPAAAMAPLKRIVREQGLWACHLGPDSVARVMGSSSVS